MSGETHSSPPEGQLVALRCQARLCERLVVALRYIGRADGRGCQMLRDTLLYNGEELVEKGVASDFNEKEKIA